jgi:4-deoxy-L-threo-5-hexosulose-uronate ketol-isomerase
MKTHDRALSLLANKLATEELRQEFLVSGLFAPDAIHLHWWETDRTVIGGIFPAREELTLQNPPGLRAGSFFERREAGLLNLGGPGVVRLDGQEYPLANLDALYVGRGGAKSVVFRSLDPAQPARFWLLSYPAHAAYPTRHIAFKDVPGTRLGTREGANERMLHKLIYPGAFPTCQLVMGVTRLLPGSVWNTMPPHTHLRRSEIYLYFNLPPEHVVFHFMGRPQETRHLVVLDGEAVLSPPWSIHSGAGTSNYDFVWGMGGENQEFADMDAAPIRTLL